MNVDRLHNVFFLGIGGIGMSALARYFHARGVSVSGYDRMASDLTNQLQQKGIKICFDEDVDCIPENADLVVYTPAIPKNSTMFSAVSKKRIPAIKRAELLGIITRNINTIAIAGTHGKTTISTLVTHILKTADIKTMAFLGGVSQNYNTNFLKTEFPEWVVVEADEFDRSFLYLRPSIALVSAMDADHLDFYGTEKALHQSFRDFVNQMDPDGTLVVKKGLENDLPSRKKTLTYHCDLNADIKISTTEIKNGQYFAALDGILQTDLFKLGLPGRHNLENALGGAAIAWSLGIEKEIIIKALTSFRGVKRRFEICFQNSKTIYIDDYAHHPEEIKACILAAREIYPEKKITALFQPHLYSRTRDLADEFIETLGLADAVWLMEIYPAREKPIEGISSMMLVSKIDLKEKRLVQKEEISQLLTDEPVEVLLSMGAGDIGRLAPVIVETLKKGKK